MKKLFSSTMLLALALLANSQTVNWVWAKNAGGSNSDKANDVVTDKNGDFYITGEYSGPTIIFGSITLTNAGSRDFFITKYDASGNVLWAKSAGGTFADQGFSISTDTSGNVYVMGHFHSPTITFGSTTLTNADNSGSSTDIFLVKYDSSGNVLWAKRIGGTNYDSLSGGSIANDEIGNVFITGGFSSTTVTIGSTILTNVGDLDVFIAKYDASGNPLWAKKGGGADLDSGHGISCDLNGNVYFTGTFKSATINFGNTTLTNPGGINNYDIFIVKYSTSGNEIWAKKAGGTLGESTNDILTDKNGNSYITGAFSSPTISFGGTTLNNSSGYGNYFIAKYDVSGSPIWASSTGSSCSGHGISMDTTGNIYVSGFFSSSMNFGSITLNSAGADDIFLVKYTDSGTVLWAKRAGGSNYDNCTGVSSDKVGHVYIVGYFSGSASFGNHTLTNNGSNDVFIAKVVECNLAQPNISVSGTTTLSSSSTNGNQWYIDGNIIPGATSQTYIVNQNGSYSVKVTDGNGCSSTSVPYDFFVVGREEEFSDNNTISVIPNPNNGVFQLQLNSLHFDNIQIINIFGQIIFQSKTLNAELDLTTQPKGIYFIRIRVDGKLISKKLVVS